MNNEITKGKNKYKRDMVPYFVFTPLLIIIIIFQYMIYNKDFSNNIKIENNSNAECEVNNINSNDDIKLKPIINNSYFYKNETTEIIDKSNNTNINITDNIFNFESNKNENENEEEPYDISDAGTIIPYGSGTVFMGTNESGKPSYGSVFGLGGPYANNIDLLGNVDSFTFSAGGNYSDIAFSMPRDGIITSASAYFNKGFVQEIYGNVKVVARFYSSVSGSMVYYPIDGAIIYLDTSDGDSIDGLVNGLNIEVKAKTKIMLIFYMVAEDLTEEYIYYQTLNGTGGGGLNIK